MKINNAIRKVVAVGAGATMMGATMFGAMAADLTSYPSPFVSAGKYNAMIVFGDKAATADVVGSIDLATNLAYAIKQPSSASGVASTTIEDGAAIETSGQKLYMGDGFSQVKQSMTDTELPALLKKGSVTDTDGTSYDYVQQIKVFNSTIDFGKTPDNLDDPVLFLTTDGTGYNYTTEINFPTAVDTTKLLGKKLTFFGKEWTVSSNANELAVNGTSGLVLYGGGVQKIMTAGDTATVDVEGTQTVVNIVGVNADVTPSTAMITVNGESKQLAAGNTET
ncbi:MAG: hypothetical protein Q8O89_04310, partial [Nanoarchaeota archaeon]|nr:hypothetical protein [Nanoarchaeota archaeon]